MTVRQLSETLDFKVLTGENGLDNEIQAVYIGDLLSWVMGRAPHKCAWITICGHVNIVAVGLLVECACIVVAEYGAVDEATISKATMEDIPILHTDLNSYEVAKKLMELGL